MNPLASGGALVEDTGSSLKITRTIPDVTFDGKNLTVTRRLPQGNQVSFLSEAEAEANNTECNLVISCIGDLQCIYTS